MNNHIGWNQAKASKDISIFNDVLSDINPHVILKMKSSIPKSQQLLRLS